MDFSVYIRSGESFDGMLELATFADEQNYFGVFLNDHVQSFSRKGNDPYLEAWTIMTGIGMLTKRVRIGHIVLFNSLRHPAFLAKSIATLDVMTNGRYECMIGAGWNNIEYEAYDIMERGRGMPSARERVDRFKEALQIIRGMLHNETFSFTGQYWNIREAKNIPQPKQQPMRISVGAKRPRMLRITAQFADGLNIASGVEDTQQIINTVTTELKKYGKSAKEFFFSGFYSIHIAKNEAHYQELVKEIAKNSNKPKDWVIKHVLVGTPEILIEKLRSLQELGIKMSVFSLKEGTKPLSQTETLSKLQFFSDEIKPNV